MGGIAAVEGAGDRRVLVLHGWGLDSGVWLTARAASDQARFTYAYFDFPGYGVNRSAPAAQNLDDMARSAITAADELGWSEFSVLGHSMGGATALRVATLEPGRVTSVAALTPVSPAGTPLDADTYGGFEAAWNDVGPFLKGLTDDMPDDVLATLVSRNRATLDESVWRQYLANWTGADFLDEVASINVPTLIAYGEADPFVTADYLVPTIDKLSSATVTGISGAGHYPMIENTADTVAAYEVALAGKD